MHTAVSKGTMAGNWPKCFVPCDFSRTQHQTSLVSFSGLYSVRARARARACVCMCVCVSLCVCLCVVNAREYVCLWTSLCLRASACVHHDEKCILINWDTPGIFTDFVSQVRATVDQKRGKVTMTQITISRKDTELFNSLVISHTL